MDPRTPPLQKLEPAKARKPLSGRPVFVLILCALCVYGTLLALLLGLGGQGRFFILVASGFALLVAYRLFQHFLKLQGRRLP